MTVVLGPGRDEDLGITEDSIKKRGKKIDDELSVPIAEIAVYVAEGQSMMHGTVFDSGGELALFLSDAIKFGIVTLMEKGKLAKTLPKTKKSKKDEEGTGHYL